MKGEKERERESKGKRQRKDETDRKRERSGPSAKDETKPRDKLGQWPLMEKEKNHFNLKVGLQRV